MDIKNQTKLRILKNLFSIPLSLFCLFLFTSSMYAATFIVDSTADLSDLTVGDGVCLTSEDTCTLRAAIQEAQTFDGFDNINFDIPESDPGFINPDGSRDSTGEVPGTYPETPYGYFLIKIGSGLSIQDEIDGMHIDGYTQSKSSRNSNKFGEPINSIIRIQIGDSSSAAFYGVSSNNIHISGLNLATTNSSLTVAMRYKSDYNWVEGCFIGTNINGDAQTDYNGRVFFGYGSSYNIAGTNGDGINDRGERNLIAGNTPHAGVMIESSWGEFQNIGNKISGNYIRTDRTGRICTSNPGFRSAIQVMSNGDTLNTLVGVPEGKSLGSEESNILGCVKSNYRGALRVSGYNTTIRGNYINTNPYGDNLNPLPGTRYEINLYGTKNTIVQDNVIKYSINSIGNEYPSSNVLIEGNEFSDISNTAVTLNGETTYGITISKNRIYDVYDKGISLLNGPNDLMNHPILKDIQVVSGNKMYVTLDLDFNPLETPYTLEFFDNDELSPSGYAQGKYYIGSVTTSKLGNNITLTVPITGKTPNEESIITNTATNSNGSTSEFSPHITRPNIVVDTVAQEPVIEKIGSEDIVETFGLIYYNSNIVLISGTTEENSQVFFKVNGRQYSTSSNSSGNFTIQLNLTDNLYEIEYYTKDSLENESNHKYISIQIDTQVKNVVLNRLGLITKIPEKDNLTYYFFPNILTIEGQGEENSTVTFKSDSITYNVNTNSEGKFSFKTNSPKLNWGTNKFEYYLTDSLGNISDKKELTLVIGQENFPIWLQEKLGLINPPIEETEIEEEVEEEEIEEEDVVNEEVEERNITNPTPTKTKQKIKFTDNNGTPLAQATVEIEGNTYVTNSEGEIEGIELEANRKYKVIIEHNGKRYEKEILGVSQAQESLEVTLTENDTTTSTNYTLILIISGIVLALIILLALILKPKKV